jgi:hypothetical protein
VSGDGDLRALERHLANAVREEVRDATLFQGPQCPHELPLPMAIKEERALIGALLAGNITLPDLLPATPSDFFPHFYIAILIGLEAIDATGRAPTRPLLVAALRSQNIGGTDEAIVEELLVLEEDAPLIVDLNHAVSAVLEASRRRRLSRLLRDADTELRTGARSAGQVSETLREALHDG